MRPAPPLPQGIALDQPSPARIYDYLLGGYHNFAIDRQAAEQLRALNPDVPLMMRANRAFLHRAVTFLVRQGLTQFLDLGSGIPTVGNVHEVAQALAPAARVVYVDRDPVAVSYSESLLADCPTAAIIQADARQPEDILRHPVTRQLLDFTQPVAVLLVAVLHFVTEDAVAERLVRRLVAALATGSYLVVSHATGEGRAPERVATGNAIYARSTQPVRLRSRAQIAHLFAGLTLVEPGLVYIPAWRPTGPDDLFVDAPERTAGFAGVARKG